MNKRNRKKFKQMLRSRGDIHANAKNHGADFIHKFLARLT